MKARPTEVLRIPREFFEFVEGLRQNLEKETGEAYNRVQVMRKMGNKLKGKLVVRGNEFDWKIF